MPQKGQKIFTDEKDEQLIAYMKTYPTLTQTANFFKCSEHTVITHIKKKHGVTFPMFRMQNLEETRYLLKRKLMQKALDEGCTKSLSICIDNLTDWSSKPKEREQEKEETKDQTFNIYYGVKED